MSTDTGRTFVEASASPRRRKPRIDAQRNRVHILDIAESYFAEHGVSGSLEAIAKRAGVGTGTFYRHFPSREALLAALMQAREDELAARRDAIRAEALDAEDALDRWLEVLEWWVTAFNGLPEPLHAALTKETSPLALKCQNYVEMTQDFLTAAQREGCARSEVRARDLFLGVLATSWMRTAALADESSAPGLSNLMRNGWAQPRLDHGQPSRAEQPQHDQRCR